VTLHTRIGGLGWLAVACAAVACTSSNAESPSGGQSGAATGGSSGAAASNGGGGKGGGGANSAGTAGSGSPGGRTGSAGSSVGGASNAGTGASGRSGSSGQSAAGAGNASAGEAGEGGEPVGDSLTDRHPDETSLVEDPAVLFHDDFEQGWGRWDAPDSDTEHLVIENDGATAHAGSGYLRSTVTEADLDAEEYISSSTRVTFPTRVDTLYWRFYARFVGLAPTPHHWVRVAAGTEDYDSSGLANTVPPGDEGFWFDFDASIDDKFNFYVYWHEMRSGRCNDGSATPGCEGDQGSTYHYGNTFAPEEQEAFARDTWLCIELMAKANTVGTSDGSLAFAVNDVLLGDYRPGYPDGTWLRDSFHPGGCDFSACTDPVPFEGFNFRTDADVRFKSVFLDAYYERQTTADRRAELEDRGLTVSSEQTIFYDDVVVATTRVGCGKFR
jgi:hypothetical protein